MKKIIAFIIFSSSVFLVSAGAQSLADIANQSRAKQKANPSIRTIDNDVLPSVGDTLAGSAEVSKSSKADDSSTNANTPPADADKDKAPPSAEDKDKKQASAEDKKKADDEQHKKADEWKQKISDQKKENAQLQRDLDVAEREARLNAAAYYADAGVMLRNQGQFAEDSRKRQEEIDSKKQALETSKHKLEDLQDEARKAGVPSNQLD